MNLRESMASSIAFIPLFGKPECDFPPVTLRDHLQSPPDPIFGLYIILLNKKYNFIYFTAHQHNLANKLGL